MVLPLGILAVHAIVCRPHEPTTTLLVCLCTAGEGVDCVWLRDLREDGLASGGEHCAHRGLWNAQVDIPRWWRYRWLHGKERGRDLTRQIDGAAHFVVPVVHCVSVLVHNANRWSCGRVQWCRNGSQSGR